ncbi:MAG: CatA-like O-acetyltransferase [Rikenellaceae bacterium]
MVEIIEIDKWKRKNSFIGFVNSGPTKRSATVLLECTNLYELSKRECIPMPVVVYHAILSAVNHFEQFRVRVVSTEYVAFYKQIDLTTMELSREKQLVFLNTLFDSSLQKFYQSYKENRKKIKMGTVKNSDSNAINTISCSALTSLNITHLSSYSSCARCERGVIRFTFGKVEVKEGVANMYVSVDFSHSLIDGYDWQLFVNYFSNEYGQEDSKLNL